MIRYLFFFISFFTFSQEMITLEKAIQYAIENSSDIKIAKNEIKINDNNTTLGTAGLLPNIVISSGYNSSVSNSEFEFNSFLDFGGGSMDQIEANNASSSSISSSLALNYTLFNGFSGIYTLKKFDYLDKISKQNLQFQIENKIIEVVMKYYEYLNKKNLYNVLKETYDISLDRYNRVYEKSKYGSSSNLDLLNAQIDLNIDLINLNSTKSDFISTKNDLLFLLGISDTTLVFDESVIFNDSLTFDELNRKQKVKNSSILMAELNYNIAKQDLKISKSKVSPKIDFSTSFSFNKSGSETSFISKQTDRGVFGIISIQFPIFNGDIIRKNIKNSRINLESKKIQLEDIKSKIELSLVNSYNLYENGLKNLEIQKENLEIFELNFQKSKDLYLLGQLNSVQFRESQLNLLNFKINYTANLFNTKIQEYLLYQFSGMLVIN